MATIRRDNPGVFAQLNLAIEQLNNLQVKTGWFESSVYADGTPVAYIAAIQEHGTSIYHTQSGDTVRKNNNAPLEGARGITYIPPRPFMRPTIIKKQQEWADLMLKGSRAVLKGRITMKKVMDQLGATSASDVAETIQGIWAPKLAKSTVRARALRLSKNKVTKSLEKPLIDSGKMFDDLTHVVETTQEE